MITANTIYEENEKATPGLHIRHTLVSANKKALTNQTTCSCLTEWSAAPTSNHTMRISSLTTPRPASELRRISPYIAPYTYACPTSLNVPSELVGRSMNGTSPPISTAHISFSCMFGGPRPQYPRLVTKKRRLSL
jgi:hypothetical protein